MRAGILPLAGIAIAAALQIPAGCAAEESKSGTAISADSGRPAAEIGNESLLEIIQAGGAIGYLIIALSLVSLALIFDQALTLRKKVLMPAGLAEAARRANDQHDLQAVDKACREQPSVLAFVLHAGISEAPCGWAAVEKAMEDALTEQSARLLRKAEYLSVIANVATMLGLLGTVVGLIMAFRDLAATGGMAQPAELAHGIYLALITTVEGLIVAIPSLAACAIFRNRVDELIAETAYAAIHAMTPLKRNYSR